MHSYGGQVGTNALDKLDIASRTERGLAGGVVHLIYMAALALEVGVSMFEMMERAGRAENLVAAQEINEDGTSMYRNARERMLGGGGGSEVAVDSGMSEAEMQDYVNALGTWNTQTMYGVLQRCAWRESPVSYVKALRDQVMSTPYQTKMVEGMRAVGGDIGVFELDTRQSMHVTMTREVVEIVRGIMGRAG
jgi:hypothetical protein